MDEAGAEQLEEKPSADAKLLALVGQVGFRSRGRRAAGDAGQAKALESGGGEDAAVAAATAAAWPWQGVAEHLAAAQEELRPIVDLITQLEDGQALAAANIVKPKQLLPEYTSELSLRCSAKQTLLKDTGRALAAKATALADQVRRDAAFYGALKRWGLQQGTAHTGTQPAAVALLKVEVCPLAAPRASSLALSLRTMPTAAVAVRSLQSAWKLRKQPRAGGFTVDVSLLPPPPLVEGLPLPTAQPMTSVELHQDLAGSGVLRASLAPGQLARSLQVALGGAVAANVGRREVPRSRESSGAAGKQEEDGIAAVQLLLARAQRAAFIEQVYKAVEADLRSLPVGVDIASVTDSSVILDLNRRSLVKVQLLEPPPPSAGTGPGAVRQEGRAGRSDALRDESFKTGVPAEAPAGVEVRMEGSKGDVKRAASEEGGRVAPDVGFGSLEERRRRWDEEAASLHLQDLYLTRLLGERGGGRQLAAASTSAQDGDGGRPRRAPTGGGILQTLLDAASHGLERARITLRLRMLVKPPPTALWAGFEVRCHPTFHPLVSAWDVAFHLPPAFRSRKSRGQLAHLEKIGGGGDANSQEGFCCRLVLRGETLTLEAEDRVAGGLRMGWALSVTEAVSTLLTQAAVVLIQALRREAGELGYEVVPDASRILTLTLEPSAGRRLSISAETDAKQMLLFLRARVSVTQEPPAPPTTRVEEGGLVVQWERVLGMAKWRTSHDLLAELVRCAVS
eukprot:SM000090S24344  [mRNA]  locus=s90:541412:545427:+ [translate_table: standard]